jgi:type I restriction enzyme, S subunit
MVEMGKNSSTIDNPNSSLPQGWCWVRLGGVCEEAKTHDPTVCPDIPFRYIDISSMDTTHKRITEARGVMGSDAPSRARQLVKANDVLVATTRPNLNAVALVPSALDGEICSTGFAVLRPTTMIDPLYLFYWVQTRDFVETVSGEVRGMLYPAVTDNQVRSIGIPLPPLPEQKRIAAKVQELMAEVERARTACVKQLEAAKAMPLAYLRQVFESEEAKKWEKRRLGETLELYDNGFWGFQDLINGVPVIRSTNFRNNGSISVEDIARVLPNIQNIENKKLQRGDILLERAGGGPKQPVGRVVLFDLEGGFYFGNFISRLRCKGNAEAEFLFLYLFYVHMKGDTLALQDQTTGIRNLRFGEYLQLPIPLPPLPIQQRLASELKEKMTQSGKLRAAIEKQLEAINALPQAILKKAFSGEL